MTGYVKNIWFILLFEILNDGYGIRDTKEQNANYKGQILW